MLGDREAGPGRDADQVHGQPERPQPEEGLVAGLGDQDPRVAEELDQHQRADKVGGEVDEGLPLHAGRQPAAQDRDQMQEGRLKAAGRPA